MRLAALRLPRGHRLLGEDQDSEAEVKVEDGIIMLGRFSVGYNFHPTRTVKTFGLALSIAADRVLFTFGPLTFIWLL